ncbi:uncharacterized protein E0L32_004654 [Thyridium curvatum]|uniref:Uncharacterized protein n=1 Tax=Thyridium curvatum TaxID=1093900 RepID=A0A507B6H2_9PEZI|nr:uncharacterized protein E0L32_004654 [Thyridium curvatum]TPX15377.1 hypothetical protein E0L32_004654 [Thyridium curvatum]
MQISTIGFNGNPMQLEASTTPYQMSDRTTRLKKRPKERIKEGEDDSFKKKPDLRCHRFTHYRWKEPCIQCDKVLPTAGAFRLHTCLDGRPTKEQIGNREELIEVKLGIRIEYASINTVSSEALTAQDANQFGTQNNTSIHTANCVSKDVQCSLSNAPNGDPTDIPSDVPSNVPSDVPSNILDCVPMRDPSGVRTNPILVHNMNNANIQ